MKLIKLVFTFFYCLNLCFAFSCSLDAPEIKVIQNEGVCPCAYNDSLNIKTIGVGYNINNQDAQQNAKKLLNINDERLVKILAGEDSLKLDEVKTLFDFSIKEAKAGLISYFPNFNNYNKNIQYVLMDLNFNMGLEHLKTFKKFKEALEKGDYQQASLELMYSNVETKEFSNYCKQNQSRCTENSNIISQCSSSSTPSQSRRFLSSITNLQKIQQCFQKNNGCSEEQNLMMANLEKCDPSKFQELYPCFYNCLKDYKFYNEAFNNPNFKMPTGNCNKYEQINSKISDRWDASIFYSFINRNGSICYIKGALSQIEKYGKDTCSQYLSESLKSIDFCADDLFDKYMIELFEGDGGSQDDPITKAISEKSKSTKCNYISANKCQFDYSTPNNGSLRYLSSLFQNLF